MIDFIHPDGFGRGASDPVGDDWSEGEKKLKRGNRSELIAALNLILVAAVVGVFWYLDRESSSKWQKELDAAADLPDGQFEAALRSILERCDRNSVLERVAYELGEQRDKLAVPGLVKLVSQGGAPALEAAKALAKIGAPEAKTGTDAIFAQMEESKDLERAEYALALSLLGDQRGFEPLLDALEKGTIAGDSFDSTLIARLSDTDKLLKMAKRTDPQLRRYAAWELGFRTDKPVVPTLLELVKDKSPDVQEAAAISLGRTTDPQAGRALLDLMQRQPAFKETIMSAISQSVGAPGLEVVYKSIPADDLDFRLDVVVKLRALRDPRAADFLFGVVSEPLSAKDEKAVKKAEEVRNQALWALEDLGDGRIAQAMFEKAEWTAVTDKEVADAAARYQENDRRRRIGNSAATWFGIMKPPDAASYLMRIYDSNKPYENTPECAQRVKVDISPLLEAMGRVGDQSLCAVIEPFLDKDKGFYFQSAALAKGRLKCPGAVADFMKRMQMTAAERKGNKFSTLEETRDWQMEDRLQERRNSIIALRFIGAPEAAEPLLRILLDVKDDQEIRREAADSLGFCSDEAMRKKLLEKIGDERVDLTSRGFMVRALKVDPSPATVDALFAILEGNAPRELMKPAGIAIGEAGDPKNNARLEALLGNADEEKRRAAGFALMLSGGGEQLDKVIALLKGVENKLIMKEWYTQHPVDVRQVMFESGRLYRRLAFSGDLADKTAQGGEGIAWPWQHILNTLRNGGEGSPGGLPAVEIRKRLADTVRTDETHRALAARLLSQLNERGQLLALLDEKGPASTVARDLLQSMSLKSR